MTVATNTAEANKWLDKAADLVSKRRDKSVELKAARDGVKRAYKDVETRLKELFRLSPPRATAYDDRFRNLAGLVKDAADGADDTAFIAAARDLATLHADVLDAIAAQKQLDLKLVRFDKSYTERQVAVAAAAGLRGARTEGSPVKAALDTAARHLESAQALRTDAFNLRSGVDMETALALMDSVAAQLAIARTEAAKVKESGKDYLKAMKAWGQLQPQAQLALKELAPLPGAEAAHHELREKYNLAVQGIKEIDGVWQGHDEAVKIQADVERLLAEGRRAAGALEAATLPPAVAAAVRAAEARQGPLLAVAPGPAVNAYVAELNTLRLLGRRDPDPTLARLTEITAQAGLDLARMTREKAEAEAQATLFEQGLAAMEALAVPPALYASAQLSGNVAQQGDIAERQWARAGAKLRAANAAIGLLKTEFETLGPAWSAKEAKLKAIRAGAVALVSFPATAGAAQALRDQASEVLAVFATGRLAPGIAAFDAARVGKPPKTLEAALADLMAAAAAKKVPLLDKGTPGVRVDDDKRKAFVDALSQATRDVDDNARIERAALLAHLDTLALAPEERLVLEHDWIAQIEAFEAGWQAFRKSAGGDPKELDAAAKAAIDGMHGRAKELRKLSSRNVKAAAGTLRTAKAAADAGSLRQDLQARLDALEAAGGNVAAERAEFAANAPGLDLRALGARLDTVEAGMLKTQAEAREALRADVKSRIAQPLKKLGISETYKEELLLASEDIVGMIDTRDPDLLAVAQDMLARMETQIAAIELQPKLYGENKDILKNQAKRIGKLEEMPETQHRLQAALTAALVLAKHTDPTVMAPKVGEFVDEVDLAEAALATRTAEVVKYRALKTAVRAKWARVEKIGKAPQFETYYEARIADAKALKKQEDGIPAAVTILNALQSKLDSVLAAPANPQAVLAALNADEVRNQRLVIEMARQYEREVAVFLETTLAQAKRVTKQSEDGDSEMAKSLEGVVGAAGKLVGPYLKNLSWYETGKAPAPDIDKMKQDFARARGMLLDAQRTAQRLIESPDSTNVAGPQMGARVKAGLENLGGKWRLRAHAFGAAVRQVADSIRAAAADGAPENTPEVKASAEKAAALVEGLSSLFRGEAFASSFAVLTKDEPEDKGAKLALQREQLAAREAALAVMRQCRTDLANPLLLKLANAKLNPFDALAVTVAVSGISTTLKEIQLQALASA